METFVSATQTPKAASTSMSGTKSNSSQPVEEEIPLDDEPDTTTIITKGEKKSPDFYEGDDHYGVFEVDAPPAQS